jgi:hypothetical protein
LTPGAGVFPLVTDTAATITDSPVFTGAHHFSVSDTAATITDSAVLGKLMVAADTAATITDSPIFKITRNFSVTDTAATITDLPTLTDIPWPGPPFTPPLATQRNFRIEVYDSSGHFVALPQDVIAGWFEDAVNGGSTSGYLRLARDFEDVSWIQFEGRVKFYLPDSVDPWWDGRIVDFDQIQVEDQDAEYIELNLEGWKTRLAYAITSDTLGLDSSGNATDADIWLRYLLSTYLDTSTFGALDSGSYCAAGSIPILLDVIQYDGTGLDEAINTIVQQVQDGSGRIFEWWVRGLANGKPGVVIQPQANPNNVTATRISPSASTITNAYQYEWKDSTVNAYSIDNTGRNIYNMIALYGGTDPTTGQQVYGPFQDSTSISLYGVRQKKVTQSNIISSLSLSNYATVFLLTNGYPQPMGQFRKTIPTDYARAGVWFQIAFPSYLKGNQVIQQVRATKVRVDFGTAVPESLIQTVSVSAPRPAIDEAFYAAISQSRNAIAVANQIPQSQPANYFVISGFDWVSTGSSGGHPVVNITPASGLFQVAGVEKIGSLAAGGGSGGVYPLTLIDSVSSATGDGSYMVVFAYDPLTTFGIFTHSPAFVVLKLQNGHFPPYDPSVLLGWKFSVVGGLIHGSSDLRVEGGINMTNLGMLSAGGSYPAPTFTGSPTVTATANASGIAGAINVTNLIVNNVPQDGLVRGLVWFFRIYGSTNWTFFAETPLPGLPLPATSVTEQQIYGDLVNNDYYDLGVAFVGISGQVNITSGVSIPTGCSNISPAVIILTLATSGLVPQLNAPNTYLIPGNPSGTPITTIYDGSAGGTFTKVSLLGAGQYYVVGSFLVPNITVGGSLVLTIYTGGTGYNFLFTFQISYHGGVGPGIDCAGQFSFNIPGGPGNSYYFTFTDSSATNWDGGQFNVTISRVAYP